MMSLIRLPMWLTSLALPSRSVKKGFDRLCGLHLVYVFMFSIDFMVFLFFKGRGGRPQLGRSPIGRTQDSSRFLKEALALFMWSLDFSWES